MNRIVVFALALLACSDGTLWTEDPEIEQPEIIFVSAAVEYTIGGTVVETLVFNDGAAGRYFLRFWETGSPLYPLRDTDQSWAAAAWLYRTTWLVVSGELVQLDRVEAWARATEETVWVMTDRYEFGG